MATISFTGSYSQDFDGLALSGSSSVVPAGWAFAEAGSNANTTYTAGTGSSNAGDTYSFGAAGSTERAFGGLQSGSLTPTIGAEFVNGTGATLTALTIAYTGEQWRVGSANRADRLDFQISFNATSLTTGTWTDVNALDFNAPLSATTGAKDGNAAANRAAIGGTVSGLSIAAGATFWIRWASSDASGADDGLAVDDFTLSADVPLPGTLVTITAPDAAASESGADPGSFRISRTGSTADPLSVSYVVGGSADAGDYSPALSGVAVIPGGASFVDIAVTPLDDALVEGTEALTLTLVDGSDYDLGAPSAASVSIADDDVPVTRISAVQGSGAASPLAGLVVTVEAIVIGDFQGSAGLSGFYLQEEAADEDGNPATSEGLFVFQGAGGTAVSVGDRVRVTGTVTEFGSSGVSLTELASVSAVTVVAGGQPLPAAAALSFPLPDANFLERYEGMRVQVTTTLAVTGTQNLARFGEVLLASDGPGNAAGTDARIDQYTQFNAPDAAGNAAYLGQIATRQLILDDASSQQNRDPIVHARGGLPLSAANTLRGGDTVSGLTGILDDRFRGDALDPYRLQPTEAAAFTAVNARGAVPAVGGSLQVAAFNVLNYFNGDGTGGGFPTSRGADSAAEFARQRDKIIAAIVGTGAEVVGLLEIENDGFGATSAIQDLVNGLNAATAAGTYAFIDPGTSLGGDAIAVGLIYMPAAVTPVGAAAVLDSSVDARFTEQNRSALAQTFRDNASGGLFTPVVNHLKSKGSSAGGVGDADSGDGQGLSNGTRTRAAEALVDWLAGDPTHQGDVDFLILGDLNAYAMEDPLRAIEAGADDTPGSGDDYVNLAARSSYSYDFEGAWGALDHALAGAHLAAQVTAAAKWHINADEPVALDYNVEFKSAGQIVSLYAGDAYRSSDHDPVVLGLALLGGTVTGTSRPDVLVGGAGNDRVAGGLGRDLLFGGADGDAFVFASLLDAYDVILDFTPGSDRLDLSALMASVGAAGESPLTRVTLFVPALPLTVFGTPVRIPHTVVLFDADGPGPGVPRPLVDLVGVDITDPNLLFGG